METTFQRVPLEMTTGAESWSISIVPIKCINYKNDRK